MSDSNHISKNDFVAFQCNTMNQAEKIKFLEHISTCNFCADQFAELMSEELITAPRNMKENILIASKRPDVQLAIKVRKTSKQMQLFIYSLKVGTATVCALLLLMLTMNYSNLFNTSHITEAATANIATGMVNNNPITSSLRDGMDNLNKNLFDFSNNIIKTEVTDYDQEKK